MDELDGVESLEKMDENSDIKNKILFSVVVVRGIQHIQFNPYVGLTEIQYEN